MSNLKTYAESEGLMPFGDDYFFGNLKGYSSALFVNPAGKQLAFLFRDKKMTGVIDLE